jgi:DNA-directed RNA polymerase subunit H (RpoH/RPB5)
MNTGLATLLIHRGRTSTVVQETKEKNKTRFVLNDRSTIICFQNAVKKSDIVALIEQVDRSHMIVTAPTISRHAGILAADNEIEYINTALYAFDLLKSGHVPRYDVMDTASVLGMEARLKCPRILWPKLRSDDPVSLYMGFRPGMCVQVRSGFYQQNIRYVIKV